MNGILPVRSHWSIGIRDVDRRQRRTLLWEFLGAAAITGVIGVICSVLIMAVGGS